MAVQLTWDAFSTFVENNDSDTITIAATQQVLAPVTPVTPTIVPEATNPIEKLVTVEYSLPDVSGFEEFPGFESTRYYSTEKPEIFRLPDIPFDIIGNPNGSLWKSILETPANDVFTIRDFILHNYKTLGQTVKIECDRGLADMARRREANYAQFFTLKEIVQFVTAALGLDKTKKKALVVDNSCGIGGMFRYLSPSCLKTGIELEEQAYHMAARLWPDAHIVQDSLVNHPTIQGDYFLINPPFSMQLEQKNIPLENASWGGLGPTQASSRISQRSKSPSRMHQNMWLPCCRWVTSQMRIPTPSRSG